MFKIGILGGGQLGRMILQAAANYPVETHVLENDLLCPAAHLCHHFKEGDIRDYDTVYNFGIGLDAMTIEIENVNVEALETLESEGVNIFPRPSVISIIREKIRQKQFYKEHDIPTADFRITENLLGSAEDEEFLPAIHKLSQGGYDGRGVQVIRTKDDLRKGFDKPAVLEKLIDIEKEIAQIIAVNEKGEMAIYPAVEMIVDPVLNLIDYQLCPAVLNERTRVEAELIAKKVVEHFHSPGIFAVEMLVDPHGKVFVNETAPRVHNSGHHTIEACHSSQFDMLCRLMQGLPLGNAATILPSLMVNIVGSEGSTGPVKYEGISEIISIDNMYVHIYGKKQTRPGRKMGHVTMLGEKIDTLIPFASKIKSTLISKT